ncbi:MAG TPA: S1C family serine protease [Pseudogracilibacillus sp.]|nr:S1C family serine protease [Pseudogracilibacillus sp.]
MDDDYKKDKRKRVWLGVIGISFFIIFLMMVSPKVDTKNEVKEKDVGQKAPESELQTTPISVDVSSQIIEVVEQVSSAIVGITNIQKRADFWSGDEINEAGTGSGVIYKLTDDSAYIVTNHHVVEEADVVEIILDDDTNIEAELLGSDIFTDLAVLKAPRSEIPIEHAINMGTSNNVKVGEPVIAIGNPLGHMFAGSVTQGVISGKQRTIPIDLNQNGRPDWQTDVLQTDAAINPGNSGGALINIEGQLIGINSMKVNQEIAQGIGFSIPIDAAKPIIAQLEETGTVHRPHMGVEIYSLEEVPQTEWEDTLNIPNDVSGGVYIWSIDRQSPAELAGLRRLDVITSFAGEEVEDIVALRKILYEEKQIGDEVEVVYYRNGKKHKTSVILEEHK